MNTVLRKATTADTATLLPLVRDCVAAMRTAGIEQWDDVYPNAETIARDIEAGTLHVLCESGTIIASITIDQNMDPLWQGMGWSTVSEPAIAVHRLMVHPTHQGRGLAKALMQHAEAVARQHGGRSIRLDTFLQNPAAMALYPRLGYRPTGTAMMRKGAFSGFEKLLYPIPSTGCAQPASETFTGQFITLTPIDVAKDVEELFTISHADDETRKLWRYMPRGPFDDAEDQAAFLREWQARPDVIAFIARDAFTQGPLGSISLMSIRAEHGVAELGNIWYAPRAQRTKTNTEACYLLLQHCFEKLRYRRMEWKCDARNERSRRAALRLGFTFEGVFRQHMIIKGQNRDTAWFAMLDHDWPHIGAAMSRWLYDDDAISLARTISGRSNVPTRA